MKKLIFALSLFVTTITTAQSISNEIKSALKSDDAKALEILITSHNINTCYEIKGATYSLLALSIKLDSKACFKLLLEKKADLEKACTSKTPLMYAVKYGNLKMAKALVKYGANAKTENSSGRTALDYAKRYEHKELQNYLESL